MFMNLLYIAVPVAYRLVGWRNVAENGGLNFSLKFRIMKKKSIPYQAFLTEGNSCVVKP